MTTATFQWKREILNGIPHAVCASLVWAILVLLFAAPNSRVSTETQYNDAVDASAYTLAEGN